MEYKVGDIRNGTSVLPYAERKKILLLSDDIRVQSGIGVISKELVLGTVHRYKISQLAAALSHPDQGKAVDMCESVRNETGVSDAYVKLYPTSGYGNSMLVRQVMEIEKPDAVMIYTDPRFFIWFFRLEHELRQKVPIIYLDIWDSCPPPGWNRPYYASVDALLNISKQTYGLVKSVLGKGNYIELDDILKNVQ